MRVIRATARNLRKRMTDAERQLWWALKDRRLDEYKFRRQHPVGPYVLDFACTRMSLAIEVDGGQHCENPADTKRSAYLESQGWRVLRFWNNDVLGNMEGVLETILAALQQSPSPDMLRVSTSPSMRERVNQ